MKDSIYTIPVTEAFDIKCECPICELESRFEKESVDYYLGPSLMEPENRIETNETGFCARHFELMYNTQANRLGLGLILETYLQEQNKQLSKLMVMPKEDSKKGLFRSKNSSNNLDKTLEYLKEHEKQCSICSKLSYTMDRYIDVLFYLFVREKDFRKKFEECQGFCIPHLILLMESSKKHLSSSQQDDFTSILFRIQTENMNRLQQEVEWFTKKFDYRNNDKPWGTSKDALIRGIKKVTGSKDLK